MSIDLLIPWHETVTMAALLKKADVLFAVNALSDGYFDNDEDRRAYAEVISDYFAESVDETDAGTECEDNDGMSHF